MSTTPNCDSREDRRDIDRESLRVQLESSYGSESTVFVLGRVLNELRFSQQVATLLFRYEESDRFEAINSSLRILLRRLEFRHPGARRIELDQNFDQWRDWFRGAQHATMLDSFEDVLRRGASGLEEHETAPTLSDLCEQISRESRFPVRNLIEEIRQLLDERPKLVFDIGYHVDQLIHPPVTSSHIFFLGECSAVRHAGWRIGAPDPYRPRFPIVGVRRQESCGVNRDRRRFLVSLFRGLAEECGDRELGFVDLPNRNSSEIIDEVEASIRRLDRPGSIPIPNRNHQIQGVDLTPAGEAYAADLGLRFERGGERLGREQNPAFVTLTSRIRRLFLHFLNKYPERVTVTWLARNWERFGRDACALGTVYTAINALNEELIRIGLQVDALPNGNGYRLEDSSNR